MGTYCLLIHLTCDSKIRIGKLGELDFKKGYYVYVGSALNSLEGRIKRHLRDEKKLFWHIDYLLASADSNVVDVISAESKKKWECKIAENISKESKAVEKFGCSDCRCISHLFYFGNLKSSKNACFNSFRRFGLKPRALSML